MHSISMLGMVRFLALDDGRLVIVELPTKVHESTAAEFTSKHLLPLMQLLLLYSIVCQSSQTYRTLTLSFFVRFCLEAYRCKVFFISVITMSG